MATHQCKECLHTFARSFILKIHKESLVGLRKLNVEHKYELTHESVEGSDENYDTDCKDLEDTDNGESGTDDNDDDDDNIDNTDDESIDEDDDDDDDNKF